MYIDYTDDNDMHRLDDNLIIYIHDCIFEYIINYNKYKC